MWTTGTGATAANTSATKRDPAHTSSTRSNARSQRPCTAATSHHHIPMTWWPSKAPAPSSSYAPVIASGLAQTSVTGCVAGSAGAPPCARGASRLDSPICETATPAALRAAATWRAASPTPTVASR